MRTTILLVLTALAGCSTPEERHFRKIARIECRMDERCSPEEFHRRFHDVEACEDASEVGIPLYAEACEDFDAQSALQCRTFMREAKNSCNLDTSDARYEDHCLGVCSNYQGAGHSEPGIE